jgi:hypothetical protein
LEKLNGQWKVTRMQFAMTQEIGSREVAKRAMAIVQSESAPRAVTRSSQTVTCAQRGKDQPDDGP